MDRASKIAALVALLFAVSAASPIGAASKTGSGGAPAAPAQASVPSPPGSATAHALTAEDAAAYFDGMLPSAMTRADIAGAVIVIVKDGQPLLERGYGFADVKKRRPVDPETTLFRPGSISKTVTWTAVMQQVEAGKIDLDADVNRYLDFKISTFDGQPITVRQLMTHSSGLSDPSKDLIISDPRGMKDLGPFLKGAIPQRIFAPGKIPAYSNYGAALAGYIVQRVSGQPFNQYVTQHIFLPLGMRHSTFEQPLPNGWAAHMSNGYRVGSGPPGPFELISAAPAGGLATSGSDMARFMIAHLQNGDYQGHRILDAKTAEQMHSPQFRPALSLPGMAFGFYQEPSADGHRVIGHGGNMSLFHSDMHLFLDDHVGLFISFNSSGDAAATYSIRPTLFKGFKARYFPAAATADLPTWKEALSDGRLLAGQYITTRRSDSGFLRIGGYLFGQTTVSVDKDGLLTVSDYRSVSKKPKRWREVGPFQYREVGGDSKLEAIVRDGKPVMIMTDDDPPVEALQPTPGMLSATWNAPLYQATLFILLIAAASWPLLALARWRYGRGFLLTGRAAWLYRLSRLDCALFLAFGWLWSWFLSHHEIGWQSSAHDGIIRLIQLVGVIAVIGVIAPVLDVGAVFADPSRGWRDRVSSIAIAAGCLTAVWFVISLKLITPDIAY